MQLKKKTIDLSSSLFNKCIRETNTGSSIYDVKKMPVLLVEIIMFILCLPPYFFSSIVPATLNSENVMNLLLKG